MIEGLKSECQGNLTPNDEAFSNQFDFTRKVKRSSNRNDTIVSESFMDDVQDEFGDFDDGFYHKPVVVTNTNAVEVSCKKIEKMM